jgi:hypothetical protein
LSLRKQERDQEWWFMTVIPALGMLRQEDHKFGTSLGYIVSSRLVWANPVSKITR